MHDLTEERLDRDTRITRAAFTIETWPTLPPEARELAVIEMRRIFRVGGPERWIIAANLPSDLREAIGEIKFH